MPETATDCCSVSIKLLPEFGWSIQGEPIYGPGSVFQGSIQISSEKSIVADDVRLRFHAIEMLRPIEVSPGVLRTNKSETLFVVEHILWKGRHLDSTTRVLPFTVQMPVVQYPPSFKHEFYKCTFTLTASITSSSRALLSTEKKISYRPFIETCLLKKPIQSRNGQLRLHALDFVPGDTITAAISSEPKLRSSSTERVMRIVTAKLYQTVLLHGVSVGPKVTKIVAAQRWNEDNATDPDFLEGGIKLDLLRVPLDVTPSFSYSDIVTVSYQLKVSVKQKKLGGLWNVKQEEFEFPINIGTLGYSVRAPAQLRIYSTLSAEEQREEVPRFMQAIEYPDALPPYDSARLPTYEKFTAT